MNILLGRWTVNSHLVYSIHECRIDTRPDSFYTKRDTYQWNLFTIWPEKTSTASSQRLMAYN
ncbi:unnamed protein product [Trichogramma brassicae]|uniref:Uncharacterized protein n=1 Tax=Trichogramma brassicae TaxID=86971 RepID=A0A6H5HZ37_9HYME|nr:unnamed protein product [Trichogramma brassicae]